MRADMHLQGRRYGSGKVTSLYNAHTTFQSYGCAHGDREALLQRMPEHHKTFLSTLPHCVQLPGAPLKNWCG